MLVQLYPDQTHVPGLGIAQQVARAAHVQIARADREPRTQPVECLQRAQPFQGARRDGVLALGEQQHLSTPMSAPDASAQLVKLRQAEAVGVDDRHGVGARHVQPRLDDVGRQKDIAFAPAEADHDVVDFGGGQLAMRLHHLQFGHDPGELFGERRHVGDARDDDETLPPRDRSRSRAARSVSGEKVDTAVRIGWRRAGGVAMIDNWRKPTSAACSVRGMGVADRVRTWPDDSA